MSNETIQGKRGTRGMDKAYLVREIRNIVVLGGGGSRVVAWRDSKLFYSFR